MKRSWFQDKRIKHYDLHARRLMDGTAGLGAALAVAVPEIIVSLLFVAPVYLLFRKVYSKVGGTKLM